MKPTSPEEIRKRNLRLARGLLETATCLRRLDKRLAEAIRSTRADLEGVHAYSDFRSRVTEIRLAMLELSARLSLPPWTAPVEAPPVPPAE
jgi:hypothetical protein